MATSLILFSASLGGRGAMAGGKRAEGPEPVLPAFRFRHDEVHFLSGDTEDMFLRRIAENPYVYKLSPKDSNPDRLIQSQRPAFSTISLGIIPCGKNAALSAIAAPSV